LRGSERPGGSAGAGNRGTAPGADSPLRRPSEAPTIREAASAKRDSATNGIFDLGSRDAGQRRRPSLCQRLWPVQEKGR
jgi:hypothetical protein